MTAERTADPYVNNKYLRTKQTCVCSCSISFPEVCERSRRFHSGNALENDVSHFFLKLTTGGGGRLTNKKLQSCAQIALGRAFMSRVIERYRNCANTRPKYLTKLVVTLHTFSHISRRGRGAGEQRLRVCDNKI